MKNNRNVIKILLLMSMYFAGILTYLEIYHAPVSGLTESIFVNLITGCFVSIVIAYIDYLDKREANINYFLSEICSYYFSLNSIDRVIKNERKISVDLTQFITNELSNINKRAMEKADRIEFDFISKSKSIKECKKIMDYLYELTFGIELYSLEIHDSYYNTLLKRKRKKFLQETYDGLKKIIAAEKEIINREMLNIKKFNIDEYWKLYMKKI